MAVQCAFLNLLITCGVVLSKCLINIKVLFKCNHKLYLKTARFSCFTVQHFVQKQANKLAIASKQVRKSLK